MNKRAATELNSGPPVNCGRIAASAHERALVRVSMRQKGMSRRVLERLKGLADPRLVTTMAAFGLPTRNALGVSTPVLRNMAREIGRNHQLAQDLWTSGIHEARILAALIDRPEMVSEKQMERWLRDFDSWGICDCCCANLFDKTPFAYRKAAEWSRRKEEYSKRAAFALMAALAVHDRNAEDGRFLSFLPIIKREARDGRNFVKKAVNWALRQIGKRSVRLNRAAVRTAREIRKLDAPSAKWIASDALRELTSEAIKRRLRAQRQVRRLVGCI